MFLPVATGGAPLPAAASSLATLGGAENSGRPGVFVSDARRVLGRFLIVAGTAVVAMLAGASFGLFQSLVGSLGTLLCALAAHRDLVAPIGGSGWVAVVCQCWGHCSFLLLKCIVPFCYSLGDC